MNDNKVLRVAVFIAVFGFVALMSTRCTLPGQFMARIVEAQTEQALGHEWDVTVERAGLRGIAGLQLENVVAKSRTMEVGGGLPLTLRIASVRVGVKPLALLGRRVSATARVELSGGEIEADIDRSRDGALDLTVRIFDVNAAGVPFVLAKTGVPLKGTLRGTIAISRDAAGQITSGNIDMNLLQTVFGDGELKNSLLPDEARAQFPGDIAVPEIHFGDVLLRAPINGSLLEVETFRQVGDDISSSGAARIQLRQPTGFSAMQGNLRLAIQPEFVREAELAPLLQMVPALRPVANGGETEFVIGGTLNQIQMNPR